VHFFGFIIGKSKGKNIDYCDYYTERTPIFLLENKNLLPTAPSPHDIYWKFKMRRKFKAKI
jgi:hypothetical protein